MEERAMKVDGAEEEDWKEVAYRRITLLVKMFSSHPKLERMLEDPGFFQWVGELPSSSFVQLINLLRKSGGRKRAVSVKSFDDVVDLVRSAKKILVLSGAGISTSCGIPDFRSSDGVYSMLDGYRLKDPQDLFSIHYFKRNTKPFYDFARKLWPGTHRPAPTHYFIRMLQDSQKLHRNYTQNIDTLEHVAGIARVLQCHGSFSTATCTRCKFKCDGAEIKDDIMNKTAPLCPRCTENPLPSLLEYTLQSGRAFRLASEWSSSSDSDEADSEKDQLTTPRNMDNKGENSNSPQNSSASTPAAPPTPRVEKGDKGEGLTVVTSCASRDSLPPLPPGNQTNRRSSLTLNTGQTSPVGLHRRVVNGVIEPDSPFTSARQVFGNPGTAAVRLQAQRSNSLASDLEAGLLPTSPTFSDSKSNDLAKMSLTPLGVSGKSGYSFDLSNEEANLIVESQAEGQASNDGPATTTTTSSSSSSSSAGSSSYEVKESTVDAKNSNAVKLEASNVSVVEATSEMESKHVVDGERKNEGANETDNNKEEGEATEQGTSNGDNRPLQLPSELPLIDVNYDRGIMKPDIVFFGESLPNEFFDSIGEDVETCDLVLVLGTSLKVAPVSKIIEMVKPTVPQILINREVVAQPHRFDVELLGNCDNVVAALAKSLGWELSSLGAAAVSLDELDMSFSQSDKRPYRFLFVGAQEDEDEDEDDDEDDDDDDELKAKPNEDCDDSEGSEEDAAENQRLGHVGSGGQSMLKRTGEALEEEGDGSAKKPRN